MLALDLHDSQVHRNGCGFHESLATDRNNNFRSRVSYCPLCAQLEQQERMLAGEDKKAKKKAGEDDTEPLPSDGRRVHTRLLTPHEAQEIRASTPERPTARAVGTRLRQR